MKDQEEGPVTALYGPVKKGSWKDAWLDTQCSGAHPDFGSSQHTLALLSVQNFLVIACNRIKPGLHISLHAVSFALCPI